MDSSQEPGQPAVPAQKQSKKRVVTAARKEQNKLAQRAYRRRQKVLKRTWKPAITSNPRRLEPRKDEIDAPCISSPLITPGRDTRSEKSHLVADPLCSPSKDVGSSLRFNPDVEDLPVVGSEFAIDQSSHPMSQDVVAIDLLTSITTLLSEDTEEHPPGLINMVNMGLGLRGSLEENSTTVFRACLSNAMCIGLSLSELLYCERPCPSPFYQPMAQRNQNLAAFVATSSYDSLPPSLRPTLAQILIPHHACLDLIPLPRLRERAILMCVALPHTFSLWDMKLDIYTRNALLCQDRDTSSGLASEPWDMRSWQAAPWFVSKWKMAVDADEVKTSLAIPGIPGLWI